MSVLVTWCCQLDPEVTMAESSAVFGEQAAKLRGPKLEVRQASTCKSPQTAESRPKWWPLVLTVSCNWNAQLMEVLRCVLMATLEDDRAQLEYYPLLTPISRKTQEFRRLRHK